MTFEEVAEMVGDWPKDRSVPRKLREAINNADGLDQVLMGNFVEAIVTASGTPEDFALIDKYF